MPSLQDIPFNQKDVAIVVESSGPAAQVLKTLNNHEWFSDTEIATTPRTSRESTPLRTEIIRYFSLGFQSGGIYFGSGEHVAFRLPNTRPHYTFISRRQFRVFLNRNRSWMLEDTSKNGTLVNDEKIHRAQIALHPENPNSISLGTLNFLLHICIFPDNLLALEADTTPETVDIEELDLQTQTQTRDITSLVPRTPITLLQNYHTLTSSVSGAETTKRLIEKSSGRHVVGKYYETPLERRKAGEQYIGLFAVLKGHKNLLPFLEEATCGDLYVIVTEFRRGCTLEALIKDSNVPSASDILKMHLQICCGALQWLNDCNVIHRNIRPAVIILNERGPVYAQLTGFSEWCEGSQSQGLVAGLSKYQAPEMRTGLFYTAAVDVYSLCALTHDTLTLTEQELPITTTDLANLVEDGLSQHPAARPRPVEVEDMMTDIIGGYDVDWSPFASFIAHKKYVIPGVRQGDEDLISALELVRLLRAYDPERFLLDSLSSLPLGIRRGDKQQHVSLRQTAKFCHQLGLEDLRSFFMEESAKGRTREPFELCWHYNARIHYHSPSLMVNISDITKIGRSQSVIDTRKARYRQKVLGIPHLEGIYVDHAFFQDVCTSLRREDIWQIKAPELTKQDNLILERRFMSVDYPRYMIIVTGLVNPNMILLRATDWTVNSSMLRGLPRAWDRPYESNHFFSLKEALAVCSHKQLACVLNRLLERDTDAETESTLVLSAESMRTTTSYQQLEAEQFQETELKFHFGRRLLPRKRTLAERTEGEDIGNEKTDSKIVSSSVTAWLAGVKHSRSTTRRDTHR